MHVFYTPDIDLTLELPEEEAAHAVRVLRLQPGDEVMLTDGKGCFYRAKISIADKKRCLVKVLEKQPQAPVSIKTSHPNIHRTDVERGKAATSSFVEEPYPFGCGSHEEYGSHGMVGREGD